MRPSKAPDLTNPGPDVTSYTGYVFEIGTLQVHHPDGQIFTFEPGSLALAYSLTGPGTHDGPLAIFQTFNAPSDLDHWAADVVGADGIRATGDDMEVALQLQAAIWSVANAVVDRRSVPKGDLDVLNELAARPSLVPRLTPGLARAWARKQGAAAVLSTVARDAIDVFGGPPAARLKRCEGARCALLFVDTSRPGHRRWCSMDRCGNRAKAAAHRRRGKESES
jgi:predicted RNA-binding Zn ribbon-like protein